MTEFQVRDFDRASFPALYRNADDASARAQRLYLLVAGVNLALLVVGAFSGSAVLPDFEQRRATQAIAAVCFLLALGTSLLLANRRWDRVWYSGRAVAESAKSLTWKFVTGADPFSVRISMREAIERYTGALRELVETHSHLARILSAKEPTGEQITAQMIGWREAAVGVVRDLYLAQRISEQQLWYSQNSAKNSKCSAIWFGLLVIFQVAAASAAILLVIDPFLPWRAPAAFSSLASATIAWGQIRRFQELAQAYGLTAQELSLISARGPYVEDREALARFVNDAETAISREHSTWIARRETR